MTLRITSWIMLVVFGAFNCRCASTVVSRESAADLTLAREQNAVVHAVFTKTGETIEFAELHPGHIRDDHIEGYIACPTEVTLGKAQVGRIIRNAGGRAVFIWTKDRVKHNVDHITADTEDSLSFVAIENEPATVLLSDVETALVSRTNSPGGLLIIVAFVGVLLLVTQTSNSMSGPWIGPEK